jgi:uncharacterized protein (TIGR03437 family)
VPSLVGKYLFADFGSGRFWALSELSGGQWRNEELLRTGLNVSSFGEDENGEVYVVDYGGNIRQIVSDGTEPTANLQGVVNAASFLFGPIAPGEIVAIFGAGIGPAQLTGAELDAFGRLERLLADTMVWFDDLAAPLFAVRSDQINAQVPYGVAGKSSCVLQVQFQGALSNPVRMPVAEAAPAFFALAGGRGPGAILNANLSVNSPSNPAARGSSVVLYATGEGQTNPPGVDGKLAELPYPTPLLPVSLTIGGLSAQVTFAGSAPGFAGLLQINAIVPPGVAPGSDVSVVLRIGGIISPPGLTLAVN